MVDTESLAERLQQRLKRASLAALKPLPPRLRRRILFLSDLIAEIIRRNNDSNIWVVAGGVAFFGFLAIFPALSAIVSIYGLVSDPNDVTEQLSHFSDVVPDNVLELIRRQVRQFADTGSGSLSFALALSLIGALWSASRGMRAMTEALTLVYDRAKPRGYVTGNLVAFALTLGMAAGAVILVFGIVTIPALISGFGMLPGVATVIAWARWPLLGLLMMTFLSMMYWLAPRRRRLHGLWINWGSVGGTAIWLAASILLSYYASQIGNRDPIYGSLITIILLMLWLYASAYAALIGAEINAALEARRDRPDVMEP